MALLDYVECRTLGHAWETQPAKGKELKLRCVRCTVLRHDQFNTWGGLMTRSYTYPEDYKLAGEVRPSIDELRLVLLKRLNNSNVIHISRRRSAS